LVLKDESNNRPQPKISNQNEVQAISKRSHDEFEQNNDLDDTDSTADFTQIQKFLSLYLDPKFKTNSSKLSKFPLKLNSISKHLDKPICSKLDHLQTQLNHFFLDKEDNITLNKLKKFKISEILLIYFIIEKYNFSQIKYFEEKDQFYKAIVDSVHNKNESLSLFHKKLLVISLWFDWNLESFNQTHQDSRINNLPQYFKSNDMLKKSLEKQTIINLSKAKAESLYIKLISLPKIQKYISYSLGQTTGSINIEGHCGEYRDKITMIINKFIDLIESVLDVSLFSSNEDSVKKFLKSFFKSVFNSNSDFNFFTVNEYSSCIQSISNDISKGF
jgi:hypothetical protein